MTVAKALKTNLMTSLQRLFLKNVIEIRMGRHLASDSPALLTGALAAKSLSCT